MTDTLPARTPSRRDRLPLLHPAPEPVVPDQPVPRIIWERIDTDAYAVSADGRTVGFVDVVGAVFVALAGHRYDRAVEVAQTLIFERAVASLVVEDPCP